MLNKQNGDISFKNMTPLELSNHRTSSTEQLESPTASSWTSLGQDSIGNTELGFSDGASQTALAKCGTNGDEDDEYVQLCGWASFQPQWLQRFRTARWVLFCLCWAGALQGMVVNGFVNVVITTIERRFSLQSTETGLIAGAYDIASFLCLIPVSYFGGAGRKPRWLGFGVLLMGLGSLVFALPHFTSDAYTFQSVHELNVCRLNSTDARACESGSLVYLSRYKYVFLLGQMMHGAGASPLYTLGVTFLDESVSTKMSSVYIGIYYAMAVIGPAIGYLIGGQFLKIYTDLGVKDPSELALNPASNVWIGAWWIGFLLSGMLSFMVAIPLLAFPKILPGAKRIQAEKISEAHDHLEDSDSGAQLNFQTSLKELPRSLRILIVNPCFMFLSFSGACEALLLNGFAAFLPKFIESQFSVAASWAALLVGVVTVPAGGGGTFLGGYLVKKLHLRCAGIIKLCIVCTLCALALALVFLISCPNIPFAGINTPYTSKNMTDSWTPKCSERCNCGEGLYDPVCSVNNVMYLSPCVAGCSVLHQQESKKWYSNCSCTGGAGFNVTINGQETFVMATGDMCDGSCNLLPIFLSITFFLMLFTFLTSMPALSATLRCVPATQRSLGLGIQWLIVRLLGSIPAPILFGVLVDSTCVLWQESCIGEKGSCRAYNNSSMSRIMLTVALIGKGVSTVSFICAWMLYKAPAAAILPADISVPAYIPTNNGEKVTPISIISQPKEEENGVISNNRNQQSPYIEALRNS